MNLYKSHILIGLIPPLCISLLLLTTASCNTDQVKKIPAEIIQPDTMAEIMISMHIAESTVMLNRVNDRQDARNAAFMRGVLQKHGTDTARYKKSFDYYTAHPEQFEEIYEEVISGLTRMQAGESLQQRTDSL
jgi:hypothetical protein